MRPASEGGQVRVSQELGHLRLGELTDLTSLFCHFCNVVYALGLVRYIFTSTKEVVFSSMFLFVCYVVSRITEKSVYQFSQNLAERWHIGHG